MIIYKTQTEIGIFVYICKENLFKLFNFFKDSSQKPVENHKVQYKKFCKTNQPKISFVD